MEDTQLDTLKQSLLYLHVDELREIAIKLSLINKGNKITVISRILHFLKTGERLALPKFPEKSCSQKNKTYPIEKNSLMLKGAYKNDLKTRVFFLNLIGPHFHFTAFGIDWLNEQWMEGNPPTYEQFAKMWQKEHERRKVAPAAPKEEWAYINFVQTWPQKDRESIAQSWENLREQHKTIVLRILKNYSKSF